MDNTFQMKFYFLLSLLTLASSQAGAAVQRPPVYVNGNSHIMTQWGLVDEPQLPLNVCISLPAMLNVENGSIDALDTDPRFSAPDTQRLQDAINDCPAGAAVRLVTGNDGASGFLTAPLTLNSGITLWIDGGVTLFASRNPQDYDNGSGACGTADNEKSKPCKPLIHAFNTDYSGIVGAGKIDGRGGSTLTAGPNAGKASWWDLAYLTVTQKLIQHVPRLLQIDDSTNFILYDMTLENSPNFHVVTDNVTGMIVWGIKILAPSLVYSYPGYKCPPGTSPIENTHATCFTPETVKNTDGFNPGQSRQVLMAYSFIGTGDDGVAIKAHANSKRSLSSKDMLFVHNKFYYTHGFSLGSETESGIHHIAVYDLSIDGFNSTDAISDRFSNNGLRIKSDSSRGGKVDDVSFTNICIRNVARPLVFDAYYSELSGNNYPQFTRIALHNVLSLGSDRFGAGQLTFYGYRKENDVLPIKISLDNVVMQGGPISFVPPHNGGPATNPARTHFTFDGGPVSFFDQLIPSKENDVVISGTPGPGIPLDCSDAFVPYNSVLPDSPI